MPDRKIIDLEWPTRYLLECGHGVAIAPNPTDMHMPGELLDCAECGGAAPTSELLTRFKAGEAINATSLNQRLAEIEKRLSGAADLTRFAADEPINAQTLNQRLDEIERLLG